MHLGFSYMGLIFLIMLMIPNLFWTKNQPKDYEKYVHNENKILLLFERAGEVLVTCLLLIFSDFNIQGITVWMIWLIAAFVLMIIYESCCRCYASSYSVWFDCHIRTKPNVIHVYNNTGGRTYWYSLKS